MCLFHQLINQKLFNISKIKKNSLQNMKKSTKAGN